MPKPNKHLTVDELFKKAYAKPEKRKEHPYKVAFEFKNALPKKDIKGLHGNKITEKAVIKHTKKLNNAHNKTKTSIKPNGGKR